MYCWTAVQAYLSRSSRSTAGWRKFPAAAALLRNVATVISLADRRRGRARPRGRATFFFDLADAGTYLAAERVERLPVPVAWQPALLPRAAPMPQEAVMRRARELRLPVVWPDGTGAVPRAMRVAAHAAREGRVVPFVLAASRLAFCGGFDLDDPAVLAEAAAAAGLELEPARAAAGTVQVDEAIRAAGRFLAGHGATTMPVVQVGRRLYPGEARLADVASALRGRPGVRTSAFR